MFGDLCTVAPALPSRSRDESHALVLKVTAVRLLLESIKFLSPRLVYTVFQDLCTHSFKMAVTSRGRKRKAWQDSEQVELPADGSLRTVALTWLSEKGILHGTLTTSSIEKKPALIASCPECRECTKQWLFTAARHGQNASAGSG